MILKPKDTILNIEKYFIATNCFEGFYLCFKFSEKINNFDSGWYFIKNEIEIEAPSSHIRYDNNIYDRYLEEAQANNRLVKEVTNQQEDYILL